MGSPADESGTEDSVERHDRASPKSKRRTWRRSANPVDAFEDEHHPIEPASDADMLQHLMEAKGVSQSQLSCDTGLPQETVALSAGASGHLSRNVSISRILMCPRSFCELHTPFGLLEYVPLW